MKRASRGLSRWREACFYAALMYDAALRRPFESSPRPLAGISLHCNFCFGDDRCQRDADVRKPCTRSGVASAWK
jgi:hypothetical protein